MSPAALIRALCAYSLMTMNSDILKKMKSCPKCNRTYADETLTFCLDDGALLSAPYDPQATLVIPASQNTNLTSTEASHIQKKSLAFPIIIAGLLIAGAILITAYFYRPSQSNQNRLSENRANTSTSNANVITPSKSLTVQIKSIGETVWLKSRVDDGTATETVIEPNGVKEFAFDNNLYIQFATSKASAIGISINGRKAKIPMNSNANSSLTGLIITKENYTQFLVA